MGRGGRRVGIMVGREAGSRVTGGRVEIMVGRKRGSRVTKATVDVGMAGIGLTPQEDKNKTKNIIKRVCFSTGFP
jgi:hypothetical protein